MHIQFFLGLLALSLYASAAAADGGVLPVGDDGKPVNTDFETGDLRDWTSSGGAFHGQPIKGNTVTPRRPGSRSNHQGNFWIGTFEVSQDGPRGVLTSKPFKVTQPWAKFLVGGGTNDASVDIVLADSGKLFFHATGDNKEDMEAVAVDLRLIAGQKVFLRIVDDHSFSWGHINFDDFKFYSDEPKVPKRVALAADAVKHAGLSPEEAVKAMTLPPGFKATLFAGEPDVHQPVGFCIDDRSRLWVAEAHTYPIRAPEGKGKDNIIIFEDSDGDGKHDKRTVFAKNLNLVSGIEVGFGGVWVGAAPYLLFIPDKDGDDKPDGEPQVLLDGWAWQDTHETLNAFNWGPDGWLYGCHGVFTHSLVGKPGTPKDQRIPLNAAVWRYHPTRRVFEVFAEGSSNPWGVDFNDHGDAFITACVIPHLYYVIPGAHYQRQAGQHFNPYVYRDRDIQNIGDHVHWLGDTPHAGNEKSGSAGGGRAHCGAMVYLGGAWPEQYRDTLFMANIHGNRINNDKLVPKGSGYVGIHAPDPVLMNDKWSRLINFKYGPDGNVYFLDWYDKQACHNLMNEIWDRSNGRIYKLSYGESKPVKVDLAKASNEMLVKQQMHANEWYVRHARRLLQERNAGESVRPQLIEMLKKEKDAPKKLRALWALYCSGAMTDEILKEQLKASDPHVRGWAIRLAAESFGPMNLTNPTEPDGEGSQEFAELFAELARTDPSPVVRLFLASALQRMPLLQRADILEALLTHGEDATDHNLPLMYWWAAEPLVADGYFAYGIAKGSKIPLIREFAARRVCATAVADAKGDVAKVKVEALSALAKWILENPDPAFQKDVLQGMADGLAGWPKLPTPENWSAVYDKLATNPDEKIGPRVRELSVAFGEERALAALRKSVPDKDANPDTRKSAIETLAAAKDPKLPPILQELVTDPTIRAAALRGLAAYEDPATPDVILKAYSTFDTPTKVDALNTLASRLSYAKRFQQAVTSNTIPKNDVSAATLRQLASLEDASIQNWVKDTFGTVRTTPNDKLREIERWKRRLEPKSESAAADLSNGRAVYAKTCAECHVLFDAGGKIGPDLTGSNRADLTYVLQNVVDPSSVIGKDYEVSLIRTNDNRVLTGIVKTEDGNALTVQTESELLTIPVSNIKRRVKHPISMMPDGLLAGLRNEEARDLVAYLASPRQVPLLATTQNAATLFNGKDLTGWRGDAKLWRVENGEIIGSSAPDGLKHNAFLFSDMTAANFRLTLKIKLAKNEGNSGIQFRSVPHGEFEAKGYQADAGPGWWGKLYEESGRALLWDKSGEAHVKKDDWNDYEIIAIGSKIRTKINGQLCVDLDDPKGDQRGQFALQVHSGGPTEVRFKDLKLEIDPPAAAVSEAK